MKAYLLSFKSGKNLGVEPAASFPIVSPLPTTTTTTQEGPVTWFPTNINSCFTELLVSEILSRSTSESIIGQGYLRMIMRLLTGTKCQVVLNQSHVSAGLRQGPHLLTSCTFSQSWNVPTSWLTLSELVTST